MNLKKCHKKTFIVSSVDIFKYFDKIFSEFPLEKFELVTLNHFSSNFIFTLHIDVDILI